MYHLQYSLGGKGNKVTNFHIFQFSTNVILRLVLWRKCVNPILYYCWKKYDCKAGQVIFVPRTAILLASATGRELWRGPG